MTRRTALIIKHNLVNCEAAGPISKENGKYMGWISLVNPDKWRPPLSSAIYLSEKEAIVAMLAVVDTIKSTALRKLLRMPKC